MNRTGKAGQTPFLLFCGELRFNYIGRMIERGSVPAPLTTFLRPESSSAKADSGYI